MSRALSLAGFQVTLIGRFWVTPEDELFREGCRAGFSWEKEGSVGRLVGLRIRNKFCVPAIPAGMIIPRGVRVSGCIKQGDHESCNLALVRRFKSSGMEHQHKRNTVVRMY